MKLLLIFVQSFTSCFSAQILKFAACCSVSIVYKERCISPTETSTNQYNSLFNIFYI